MARSVICRGCKEEGHLPFLGDFCKNKHFGIHGIKIYFNCRRGEAQGFDFGY